MDQSLLSSLANHLQLDPESGVPLIAQLTEGITWLIASEELQEGDRLPPMRQLAKELGVHMHTVRQAYQRLEAEGLVSVRPRRGTIVLAYDPATVAERGADSSTNLLGVILPNPGDFYSPLIRAIQEAARDLRYLPLFCYTFENPYLAQTYFNQLIARQVDGFIFASIAPALLVEEPRLIEQVPPIVSVDVPDMSGYQVLLDSEGAGYQLTTHLLEHGCRRIGLITPPLEWPNVTPFYQGFERALQEAGLEQDPELTVQVEGFFDYHGKFGAADLLELDPPPDAIMAASDTLALGALELLQERGLSVPGDFALTGYTDIPAAALVRPGLTTAALPAARLGELAMVILSQLLEGRKPSPRTITIAAELIIRESCGCQ